MQYIQSSPQSEFTAPLMPTSLQVGTHIPALKRAEAMQMSAEELRRFIAFIETLADDDWNQPTACTLWTVKDIVSHQAAHVVSLTGFTNFVSQQSPFALRPYLKRGMSMLDAWNQSEVDKRRDHKPDDIITEIRSAAEKSLRGRNRIPAFLRAPNLPLPGLDQSRSLGYLFDVIYTRDMWMHRLDIHNAIGRVMPLDAGHDRRMVELIVRDLAYKAVKGLNGRAMELHLTSAAGGVFHIGANVAPSATVELDVPAFASLTSGRENADNVVDRVGLSGDTTFGHEVVNYLYNRVLY